MLVNELIASGYIKNIDCLVFVVMSHGDLKKSREKVMFSNNISLDVEDDIIAKFNNHNCKALIDKPKKFMFPLCRYVS